MIALFENISTWKLFVDLALMGSLLILCFRFLKTPSSFRMSKKIGELEGTLKSLIKEAESSGRGLNDQLLSRHSELRKLLYELDSVEHRLQKSIAVAEEQKTEAPKREVQKEVRKEVSPKQTTPSLEYIFEPVETPPPPVFDEAVGVKRAITPPVMKQHSVASEDTPIPLPQFSRLTSTSEQSQQAPKRKTPPVQQRHRAPLQQRLVPEKVREEIRPPESFKPEKLVEKIESSAHEHETEIANVYSAAEQLIKETKW
jgi:hypothetical protein